jgi:hypothetical protein
MIHVGDGLHEVCIKRHLETFIDASGNNACTDKDASKEGQLYLRDIEYQIVR